MATDAPAMKAQGAPSYFGDVHKNVFFSRSTHPTQIKFDMRYKGNEALSGCVPFLSLSPPKGRRTVIPHIRYFLQKFKGRTTRPNALEMTRGLLENV